MSSVRWVGSFELLALTWVGCGAIVTSPPPPPLAEPIPDGPTEFRWKPFKWEPGVRLTYEAQAFFEARFGTDTRTESGRFVYAMVATERSAKGLVRVTMTEDGRDTATMLIDEGGRVQDVNWRDPKKTGGAPPIIGQHPLASKFASRGMELNERYPVEIEESEFIGSVPAEVKPFITFPMRAYYEFTGYRRLGGRRVVSLRVTIPNVLKAAIQTSDGLTLDSLAMEGSDYIDANRGVSVASYIIMTMGGVSKGQKGVARATMRVTLDERNSSGI